MHPEQDLGPRYPEMFISFFYTYSSLNGLGASDAQELGPRAMSHSFEQHTTLVGVCASAQIRADDTECFSVKVAGCVGFQRKGYFFRGRPLLRLFYICTLFSKQEPCSLSQTFPAILRARVEPLGATRALATIKTPTRG